MKVREPITCVQQAKKIPLMSLTTFLCIGKVENTYHIGTTVLVNFFVNLTQPRVILEEEISTEKTPQSRLVSRQVCVTFS